MSRNRFKGIHSNLNFTPEITKSEKTNIHRHIFHDMDGMRKMKDSLDRQPTIPCVEEVNEFLVFRMLRLGMILLSARICT